MKKTFLIVASIAMALTSNAQKIALHSSSGIQHFEGTTALQSAYTASVAGDTIYLSGGGTYNSPNDIAKSLTIYGAGHYPDSATATGTTTINGNIILRENADNFHMEGVYLTGRFVLNTNEAVDNVTVQYCNLGSEEVLGSRTNLSNNTLFVNIVCRGTVNIENAQNLALRNSIIANSISNSHGGFFSNNIIMNYIGSSSRLFAGGSNNYIENNIIFTTNHYNNISNDVSGNTFKNNVMNAETPYLGNFSESSEGNYIAVSQADFFVNQTGTAFDYAHDYHLQDPTTYVEIGRAHV